MAWIRNCPDCNKVLYYHSYKKLWESNKFNRRCVRCAGIARRGFKHTDETKKKISNSAKKNTTRYWKGKRRLEITGERNPFYGKKHTKQAKRKMSEAATGRTPSEETRKKLRLARLCEIEKNHGQIIPNYNPKACRLIEEYGKQHGYNFQHAENGGEFHIKELGFWVDGYDAEQNIVIEVDESHHFQNGKLKKKDVQRQKEIIEHINCKFIRIKL